MIHNRLGQMFYGVFIALLVVVLVYLLVDHHHARPKGPAPSMWGMALPSHFTIPILSPWTSVVSFSPRATLARPSASNRFLLCWHPALAVSRRPFSSLTHTRSHNMQTGTQSNESRWSMRRR